MTHIRTPDGIELAYEQMGNPADPAVILIMGLGAQMRIWPDSLCQALVDKGYRVVRFDNRDVGRSTQLDHHGTPACWPPGWQPNSNAKHRCPTP
ncbi:MAG: hypothetical protein LRY72_11010 [Saccharospirillaceae bacterium]|nr:hypothetical protein [Saccharospirillaceae bacterium]